MPRDPVATPTLCVTGAEDGCALPWLASGQEMLFPGGYRAETWDGVGHYPHLERPGRTVEAALDWFGGARR